MEKRKTIILTIRWNYKKTKLKIKHWRIWINQVIETVIRSIREDTTMGWWRVLTYE